MPVVDRWFMPLFCGHGSVNDHILYMLLQTDGNTEKVAAKAIPQQSVQVVEDTVVLSLPPPRQKYVLHSKLAGLLACFTFLLHFMLF